MVGGFGIGRLFGISIRIDWSWLFIFAWITFNLATDIFPAVHPRWDTGLTWGLAIVASLLFFASVLAHELAHSLVARAQGLPVENITLFLFGGVSSIQREPPSPGVEFRMTVVGPLTSIAIGVIIYLLSQVTASDAGTTTESGIGSLALRDSLSTLLLWLGPINVILGIFNLIPGFPLDGGRILRSILWAATGRPHRATRWAAWVGQAIGWILITIGIAIIVGWRIPYLGNGLVGGLWAIFIGWFLNSAASQSYQQVIVHDILGNTPVSRLMRTEAPTTPPTASISSLVHDHIMGTNDRAFPVVQDERLLGLICLDDVRKVPRDDWTKKTVADAMTPADQLAVISARGPAAAALDELGRRDVNQLPVLENGRLVGLLRRQDVLKWLHLHAQQAKL